MKDAPIQKPSDLGSMLRARRKKFGYTQAKVAALCDTGIRFISDLENGKATIELGKALMVAAALGLDVMVREREAGE